MHGLVTHTQCVKIQINYNKMLSIKKIKVFINQNLEKIILSLSIIVSVTSFLFYFIKGLTLEYNDATSHLDIARRILHSLTPGLVQIGSNWLPLLHILELPLSLNFFLYQTGIAGSVISMLSFCFSSLFIFKIILFVTKNKYASIFGVIAFITNGNMLYMQTAPMFEPLLIATSLAAIFYLIKWTTEQSLNSLLIGAFFVLLASMTRYDGWFLFLGGIIFVFIVSYFKKNYHIAESYTIIFTLVSGFGIVLWFLYNQLIFGSATYFMNSEFSARGQQIIWEQLGKLPARHNLLISTWTYGKAALYNIGIISSMLGLLGVIVFYAKKNNKYFKFALALLFVPFVFNIIALFIGYSIIWIPGVPPYDNSFFNVRYGLLMVPTSSIFIGLLTSYINKYMKILLLIVLIFQGIIFYSTINSSRINLNVHNLAILKDTIAGKNINADKTSIWIRNNCKDKLTFISAASYESVIFYSGLDMNKFITEGTGDYWKKSLKKPSLFAACIIYGESPIDKIRVVLKNDASAKSDLASNFKLMQTFGTIKMYKKIVDY